MIERITLAVLFGAGLAVAGCKKKQAAGEPPPTDAAAATPTTARTPAAPVDPDPYFVPDDVATAAVDAAPLPVTPISEAGAAVFTAAEREFASVSWRVDATDVAFAATSVGSRDDSEDVQVVMSSGGRSQQLATCRNLSRSDGGAVTAYSRGADTAFIACFSKTEASDPGKSWGVRVKWNKDKRIAELAGTWENQGPPAFDTMDFDEAE